MDLYRALLRPLLFSGLKADPEWAHNVTLRSLATLDQAAAHSPGAIARGWLQTSCQYQHPALEQTLWGLKFPNPLGLAAGFDKDGTVAGIWSTLGFGFAELGTVTFRAQSGNSKPRLFRLLADEAVLNRMGFNNQGAAALAARLEHYHQHQAQVSIPWGVNLGKSKVTPLEQAVDDYVGSFRLLKHYGDYFVVNVSSPNTPGLRTLQASDQLGPILAALQDENQAQKPLLVKIAPDLAWEAIAEIIALAQQHQLAGIIATNTTISRDRLKTQTITRTGKAVTEEAGGISGAPLRQRSTEVIAYIRQQTQGQLPIIGVGGIFTAEDAWEKLTAGASLLQTYTGLVYEGPWMMKRVLQGLVQRLEAAGLSSIQDVVGRQA